MKPLCPKHSLSILLSLVCAITLLGSAASAQQPDNKVSHPGLFSYQLPPGWRALTLAKIENPVATDPAQRETNPYIQVDTVTSVGSLADFIESSKRSMKVMVPSTEFVEQTPFVTAAGAQGIRMVVTAHPGMHDQKAVYYLFEGPKSVKIIVFANVIAAGFQKNVSLFDAAARTLEIGR